jgi:hypothetical protein
VNVQNSFSSAGLTGVWEIQSGTGAYEGISGHGTDVFVYPASLTLTGLISRA